MFAIMKPKVPSWTLTSARQNQHPISLLAAEGLALVELLGGAFAAMAVGAAVIGALSGRPAKADQES